MAEALPAPPGRAPRIGHRALGAVGGALGGGDHHRAGPVVLEAAVEEAEGLRHQARRQVVVHRHGPVSHHGPGVAGRVGPGGHGHVPHLLGGGAEAVHVAAQHHGVGDGRAEHAEGHGEGDVGLEQAARPGARAGRRGGPARRAMLPGPWPKRRNWPWHSDRYTTTTSAAPALDRHGGVGHRRAGPAAAGEPRQAGVAQLGQAQVGGHEGGLVAVLGERRQAVDVVGGQPGVGQRGQDRLDRQLVLAGVGDAAPFGVAGLAHPDEARRLRPPARHGTVSGPLGADLVGVLAEQRGAAVASPTATPWARNGAPA